MENDIKATELNVSQAEKIASKMSQEELVNALYIVAKSVKNNFNRKEKTSETEIQAGLVSRAKSTTLVAKSYKATRSFNTDIEHMKILLKYIW